MRESAVSGASSGRVRAIAGKGFAVGVPAVMLAGLAGVSVLIFEAIGLCLGLFG